jgi:sRNA-binding carbon storage regulator CsrA
MLVLTRKVKESVLLGDEVTLTLEEICGSDDQRISGARARLGFEVPRYVPIIRSGFRSRQLRASWERSDRPKRQQAGFPVDVPGATMRIRITVPKGVPVLLNNESVQGSYRLRSGDGETPTGTTEHVVSCRKEDRIRICNNMIVVVFGFQRFTRGSGQPCCEISTHSG